MTGTPVAISSVRLRLATVRRSLIGFLAVFLAFCVLASIISYRTRAQGLITSDGKSYYAWLRSIALDGDLDFRNDYNLIYPPEPLPLDMERVTPRGLVANKYPVGFAVIAAPGFLAGHVVAILSRQPRDGVSAPYQFAVTIWLQLFCLGGLFCIWMAAVRLDADPLIAGIVVVGALIGTNLLHYTARPAMPHGPGFAALCYAAYFGVAAAGHVARRSRLLALTGAFLGLAAIIRPTNMAMLPFYAPLLLPSAGRSPSRWLPIAFAFGTMLLAQVGLMSLLWGRLTFSGYTGEGFTSGLAGIGNTLMSDRHGLFVYHPWYFAALVCCIAAVRSEATRQLALGALASFVLLACANGTWWAWWFGDSFGNRAFVEIIPALALTASAWLSTRTRHARAVAATASVVAFLAAANALLWSGYILRQYPADGRHTAAQAWLWPWR